MNNRNSHSGYSGDTSENFKSRESPCLLLQSSLFLAHSSHLRWLVDRIVKLISQFVSWGRDSIVSRVTRYGLDDLGIESRWRHGIPHPFRPALEPTQPPVKRLLGLFLDGKAAGAWLWPPPPPHLVPRLKKEYNYTNTLLWAFMAWSRWALFF